MSITTLGSSVGDAAGAAGAVLGYLEGRATGRRGPQRGGPKAPAPPDVPEASGPAAYYADSVEGPGTWTGHGVGSVTMKGTVAAAELRRLLLAQDPRTGTPLREINMRVPSSPTSVGSSLTTAEAAGVAGVSPRYLRRVLAESETAEATRVSELLAGRPLTPPPATYLPSSRDGRGGYRVDAAALDHWQQDRNAKTVVVGYDVTFSAPKSVSILWAAGDARVQSEVLAAIDASVAAGITYLEHHGAHIRSRGQRLPADGLLGASYLHGTSRALDPQLHRHVVLGNVVAGPDGSVRALDSASLYAHAKTAGYVAASELRWQLTDRDHAGAQGPMQFLPATWAAYGVDGDGDGVANIYDPVDAIWGAARMLCANGAGNPDTVRAAVFSYNHADSYVQQVMAVAATYEDADPSIATGAHALPVDRSWFVQHPTWLTLPHHDYPAIDIPVPVGTTAFAAVAGVVSLTGASVGSCGGTVLIDGDDGTRYTYCHLSAVAVTVGQRVAPGEPVAASGGAPGAPGAGDSTGPHLHFAIAVQGVAHCPQPALATWAQGSTYDPAAAPTSGCTTK